jgi:putative toxin-antitoxin system antitoxin component (TIGR02293 family)
MADAVAGSPPRKRKARKVAGGAVTRDRATERLKGGDVQAMQARLRAARAKAQKARQAAKGRVTATTILGLNASVAARLPAAVASGLPFQILDNLADALEVSTRDLAEGLIGITRPTLSRRRKSGTLTRPESDAAVRYARLLEQATAMMEGDGDAALRWLKTPLPILGGDSPLEHARTEAGGREVELLIGRIEHGVYS